MTDPIRFVITIVEHGKGEMIADLANQNHVHFNLALHGHGTATSDIMDMLGLGTTQKDVVISMLPKSHVKNLLHALTNRMLLKKPGTGIAFSLPLSGINELIARVIENEMKDAPKPGEGAADMSTEKHRLVLAVVNQGVTDQVMAAAREAGATGGTLLQARGIGRDIAEPFLGVSLQSEKVIVLILCEKEKVMDIMQAINQSFGPKTKSKGIVCALPVTDMIGLGK